MPHVPRRVSIAKVVREGGVKVLALGESERGEGKSFMIQLPDDDLLAEEPYTVNDERGVVVECGIESVKVSPDDRHVTFMLTSEASLALGLPRKVEFLLNVSDSARRRYNSALRQHFMVHEERENGYTSVLDASVQLMEGAGKVGGDAYAVPAAGPADLSLSVVDGSRAVTADLRRLVNDIGIGLNPGVDLSVTVTSVEDCRMLSSCIMHWLERNRNGFELRISGPFADSTLSTLDTPGLEEFVGYMIMAAAGYE